jgi:hypothetical protein
MARDEYLDDLGRKKQAAFESRKVRKELVDAAKKELDSYQPLIEQAQRDVESAAQERQYCRDRAGDARRNRDRTMASYYQGQAEVHNTVMQGHLQNKRNLISQKQRARDAFNRALDKYREANNDFQRYKQEFDERLTEVRARNERERAERTRERQIRDIRGVTRRPGNELEAGNAFVNGHPAYYEKGNDGNPERMDLFEGGVPRAHHKDIPHPHIVTEGDDLKYMREEDGTILADEDKK